MGGACAIYKQHQTLRGRDVYILEKVRVSEKKKKEIKKGKGSGNKIWARAYWSGKGGSC